MTFKFLIDECLSPELVEVAVKAGHSQSTCVRNRGWSGTKDHKLIEHVVREDFTLVTHNAVDFRGNGPGNLGGEHARQAIHAGLVCLSSELPLELDLQVELFELALDVLAANVDDLVNQALDISHRANGSANWAIYPIPEA